MASKGQAKSSLLSLYFSEIRNFPLLSKTEEKDLARDIKNGSQDAVNELVESNLSFVAKVASEYRSLGLPFEDLLNEGNVGLIEAAHRFDASRDTKFISYAIWWIRKSILKALSEQSGVVRLPYSQMKKVKEIRKAEKALTKSLGRKPKREEISDFLSKSLTKIDAVLQHSGHEVSLDEPVAAEHDTSLGDCIVDDRLQSVEESLLDEEMTAGVGEVFVHLSEQQQRVITYRFGLDGRPPLTLQETGARMALSRERVRQIECQAKERMRKLFARRRRINLGGARRDFRPPASPSREAVAH